MRCGQRFSSSAAGLTLLGLGCLSSASARADESQTAPSSVHTEEGESPWVLVVGMGASGLMPPAPHLLRDEFAPGARLIESKAVRFEGVTGRPLAPDAVVPPGGVRLIPMKPGVAELPLSRGPSRVTVLAAHLLAADGSRAPTLALSRELPTELELPGTQRRLDEGFRLVLESRGGDLPSTLEIVSESPFLGYLDAVRSLGLVSAPCPPETAREAASASVPGVDERVCATTPLLRLAPDTVERNHPALTGRALLGEVGGTLTVKLHGTAAYRVRIAAPRALDPNGPGRYLAKVRARVVRTHRGGPPAVGADDAEAIQILKSEITAASRMWGACGVHLGDPAKLDVEVVDPPDISMLTVGCGRAATAAGGTIALEVGQRLVKVKTLAGQTPRAVASRLTEALDQAGVKVRLLRNATVSGAAGPSFDLILSDVRGRPVSISGIGAGGLDDDPALEVCAGSLDLADGLEHFSDENASSGTIEERMLLRSLGDDDPATIELYVVPVFAGIGRIGESFLASPLGTTENALILDRTGIRAGSRSFTLAHELGHILLDLPGHPDDFGVDTPTSLMDADAADPTIFGPRRLSLDDCRRALRQSGQSAPSPLLFAWPFDE